MIDRRELASNILWNYLKNERLGGYNFIKSETKNYEIPVFFYCKESRILIRVGLPDLQKEIAWQDEMVRRHQLSERGIVIYSFHPEQVICRIDNVLSKILASLHKRAKHWRETVVMLN